MAKLENSEKSTVSRQEQGLDSQTSNLNVDPSPAAFGEQKSSASKVDQNPEDLQVKTFDRIAPAGEYQFKNIQFVHSKFGDKMIHKAGEFIREMKATLGLDPMKPTVAGIDEMYTEAMRRRKPSDYLPVVGELRTQAGSSMDDMLKLKTIYEQSSHKNNNAYLLNTIQGGMKLAVAEANWDFAVNTYKETKQNGEAFFKEAVYAARIAYRHDLGDEESLEPSLHFHVEYYTESVRVASAIDKFGDAMGKANIDLIKAYNVLLEASMNTWNQIAKGEVSLLLANRKDSLTMWTGFKVLYAKLYGPNRNS